MPGGEVQAQCAEYDPNECANPCYVPSPFENEEFDDANSRADCNRILQEVLEDIKNQFDDKEAAWKAAKYCDTRYEQKLQMNNLRHSAARAAGKAKAEEIFWECMSFGGVAGRGAGKAYSVIARTRTATVTVVRVGSSAVAGIVGFGTFTLCRPLRNDTAQSMIVAVNAEKKLADKMSLAKRDECRRTTNYSRSRMMY